MQKSVVDKRRFDIWRYRDFYLGQEILEQFLISDLRTSLTPLEKLDETLWIKHEDQHPLGSHKGRSLAYQLSFYMAQGDSKFVLSSSGNAAIAFLSLTPTSQSIALVSPNADSSKVSFLQSIETKGKLVVSSVPASLVRVLVNKYGYVDLRPSRSDAAVIGLSSIGFELWEQFNSISSEIALVGVTTSGGNMLGLFQAFTTLLQQGYITSMPRLYPVLLKDYKGGYMSRERMAALEEAVKVSGGRILNTYPVKSSTHATSFEGNTAYQAYVDNKAELGKTIVLFTGRIWPATPSKVSLPVCNSISDLSRTIVL